MEANQSKFQSEFGLKDIFPKIGDWCFRFRNNILIASIQNIQYNLSVKVNLNWTIFVIKICRFRKTYKWKAENTYLNNSFKIVNLV